LSCDRVSAWLRRFSSVTSFEVQTSRGVGGCRGATFTCSAPPDANRPIHLWPVFLEIPCARHSSLIDERRLNVTVSAEFLAELEQVRAVLSHKCLDGNFEQVVCEAFKLVLERDRKRKALTDRPSCSAGNSRRKQSLYPRRGKTRRLAARPHTLHLAYG
jgi:hypothetical protein